MKTHNKSINTSSNLLILWAALLVMVGFAINTQLGILMSASAVLLCFIACMVRSSKDVCKHEIGNW